MANTLLSPTEITRETLRILHQKLRFISTINRQYDSRFARDGAKIGTSLQIRLPNQFAVRTGATMDAQDVTEKAITLNVNTQAGVDFSFPSADLTMTIDRFSERYLDPAATQLAAYLETQALTMYQDVNQQVLDDGDTLSNADVLLGSKYLTQQLCPPDGRTLLLHPDHNADLVNANTGLFNPQGNISGQFRKGQVQDQFFGYSRIFESSLMKTHTSGTDDGTADYRTDIAAGEDDGTSTNPEDGGSLHLDTGAGTFTVGDVIEIEDVNEVHRESKVTLGRRMRFVVTTAYGGGEDDLQIYPACVASGAKQNVDAAPATDKKIYKVESDSSTAVGASATYNVSLGYHRDAFTFVTADLEMPKGTDMAAREVADGISLRFIRDYTISSDVFGCRFDVYFGYKCIRPLLAVRYGT